MLNEVKYLAFAGEVSAFGVRIFSAAGGLRRRHLRGLELGLAGGMTPIVRRLADQQV